MATDLVAGDTASVLEVTCKNKATGAVIDLTGANPVLSFSSGSLQSVLVIGPSRVSAIAKRYSEQDSAVSPALELKINK